MRGAAGAGRPAWAAAAPCTGGSSARGGWAPRRRTRPPRASGMRPAKSLRNMVANPKMAFVGSPLARGQVRRDREERPEHQPRPVHQHQPLTLCHARHDRRAPASPGMSRALLRMNAETPRAHAPLDERSYRDPHPPRGEGAGRPPRVRPPRSRARGDRPHRAARQRRRARQPRDHLPGEGGAPGARPPPRGDRAPPRPPRARPPPRQGHRPARPRTPSPPPSRTRATASTGTPTTTTTPSARSTPTATASPSPAG